MKISESQLDDIRRTPRQTTVEEVADLADDLFAARLALHHWRQACLEGLDDYAVLRSCVDKTDSILGADTPVEVTNASEDL